MTLVDFLLVQSIINISLANPIKLGNTNNTKLQHEGKEIIISGGKKSGKNTFHHFSKFNIPHGKTVNFIGADQKSNIFSFISGNSRSRLSGELVTNANIYLINKRGFILDDGLYLNLKGQLFIGSPSKIEFTDGSVSGKGLNFSKLPQGDLKKYHFESNNSRIIVNGKGHNIRQVGSIFSPNFGTTQSDTGIVSAPGLDITLAANKVSFDGGELVIPSGKISLIAVDSGETNFNAFDRVGSVDYGLVRLDNRSLINSTGGESSIIIHGKRVDLINESLLINSNPTRIGKSIIQIYTDNLNVLGQLKDQENQNQILQASRGIISQTFQGRGADIEIDSKRIVVDRSGAIISSTFGSGRGGDIDLDAEIIRVSGGSDFGLNEIGSLLLTTSAGSGRSGNLNIRSSLNINKGGFVASGAFRSGDAGVLTVNAPLGEIVINGGIYNTRDKSFIPSLLATTTISSGKGGKLIVNSEKIRVLNGGRIDASSLSTGDAGSIQIRAQTTNIVGTDANRNTPSSVKSSSDGVDPLLDRIFELPGRPEGNAGLVQIRSEEVSVTKGAEISVTSTGDGTSGNLNITSNQLSISDSLISASTINGNGGQINIDSNLVALLKSGAIEANSQNELGGRIMINSGSLLVSPDSSITASSALGTRFAGTVTLNTVPLDVNNLSVITTEAPQPQAIAASCNPSQSLARNHGIANSTSISERFLKARDLEQRLAYANKFYYVETGSNKIQPFQPLLAVEKEQNGSPKLIFSAEQSRGLTTLLSSLAPNCDSKIQS